MSVAGPTVRGSPSTSNSGRLATAVPACRHGDAAPRCTSPPARFTNSGFTLMMPLPNTVPVLAPTSIDVALATMPLTSRSDGPPPRVLPHRMQLRSAADDNIQPPTLSPPQGAPLTSGVPQALPATVQPIAVNAVGPVVPPPWPP